MRRIFVVALLCGAILSMVHAKIATALFAGGSFWDMQAEFDQLNGVLVTVVGYDGGTIPEPTYNQVATGKTGYVETVRVIYNTAVLNYSQLLDFYWHHIDPTQGNGQICYLGKQYQAIIFYADEKQKQVALASKKAMEKRFPRIMTKILPTTQFYAAEDEHQSYYEKNRWWYKYHIWRCGRKNRLDALW